MVQRRRSLLRGSAARRPVPHGSLVEARGAARAQPRPRAGALLPRHGVRALARGRRRVPPDLPRRALRGLAGHDRRRGAAGARAVGPRSSRRGQPGLGRGPRLLRRAQPAAPGGGAHGSGAGRRRGPRRLRGHRAIPPGARDLCDAIPSVPARSDDERLTTSPAPRLGRENGRLDHRGRLRQRVPLRAAPDRLAPGARSRRARDLRRNLLEDHVPGAARGVRGPPHGPHPDLRRCPPRDGQVLADTRPGGC